MGLDNYLQLCNQHPKQAIETVHHFGKFSHVTFWILLPTPRSIHLQLSSNTDYVDLFL